ncbi:MAG: ATP-dependent helicase [Segniliparus sp.]|uniref:ATP-dependent helicase n=1 Tax=Segniliparus sp. TaxID=2804064 RepID=UPI003F3D190E
MSLADFSAATQEWFAAALGSPTPAQAEAWASIARGGHTLVSAPTGSGKTLAAFLWAIDRLHAQPPGPDRATRILYISPLKALAEDVRRNLEVPLDGIAEASRRAGAPVPEISVGLRSGDTSAAGRRELVRRPPDILITTPESLFLMLTSRARETLAQVRTVIVDEVHDLVGTKRGAHLALSLARLDASLDRPAQRVGLSATVRPLEEAAQFLANGRSLAGSGDPVGIVAPPAAKTWDLEVRAAAEDLSRLDEEVAASGRNSVWPKVEQAVLEIVLQHRSAIVFVNSRTTAERFVAALNERCAAAGAGPEPVANAAVPGGMPAAISSTAYTSNGFDPVFAKAHHGSVSKEARALVEADLKAGRLRCVVATSSLELGIDMGSVDVVVQIGSPPSVASGLQRVGRAGHQVGAVSRGVVFPLHRLDVAHCAVTVRRMRAGEIESIKVLRNPLDVLAQHTVSASAAAGEAGLGVTAWFETVRAAAPFRDLPRSAYESVLDLLSGRYPADFFGELRPRLVWDRAKDTLTARPGAAMLAAISGGTIPDRGLYGVFLVGEASSKAGGAPASRVGELDEEMVYESRVGDVIQLGAASWRIMEITHDRVLVVPAPGLPARLSFWKGDGPGRPAELGRAVGQFLRECDSLRECDGMEDPSPDGLDAYAAANLASLLDEQRAATGVLPTDETLVVERFRDPLGDWHIALLSPYGGAVHAPWALAVAARLRERYGFDESPAVNDDGIVVRLPDTDGAPPGAELFVFEPDEIERVVERELGGSALFAARFRECSARALLLPRKRPGQRTALWLQRLRSAQLLDVAKGYPQFPMLLETMRECLQDVYDLPALVGLLSRIEQSSLQLAEVETPSPSPFARSLLFGYDGLHMYEDDRPLAERRAAALRVDEGLLGELLGRGEAQDLLDPEVVRRIELELQRLAPQRRARTGEALIDLLRELGPLTTDEVNERAEEGLWTALPHFHEHARVTRFERGGQQWWAAPEDAGRLRDALGIPPEPWVPEAFLDPTPDPLGDLVARYARTHGPFTAQAVADRLGLGGAVVAEVLGRLGTVVRGRSSGEWCSRDVMSRLRKGSLAALRQQIEPVGRAEFARFLLGWQHVGSPPRGAAARPLRGAAGLLDVVDQLAGARLPVSALETLILPSRVADYAPALLDEALASGEAYWAGAGEGWVRLYPSDLAPWQEEEPKPEEDGELAEAMLRALSSGGAFFLAQIERAVAAEGPATAQQLQDALRALAWSGRVTSDTFAPVREWAAPTKKTAHGGAARLRGRASHRSRRPRLAAPRATGTGGRWALVPGREPDPTARALARAQALLDRYGVVTRDVVSAEEAGFSALYQVLVAMEDAGACRRGYFVDSLGGAQFAAGSTVDLLRDRTRSGPKAVALAATDPANPYGAGLPWPELPHKQEGSLPSARPGRKAGAVVVLVDGEPVFYLERGGASLVSFRADGADAAAEALAQAGRRLGGLVVERLDGESVHGARGDIVDALIAAGFALVPRGLRLR